MKQKNIWNKILIIGLLLFMILGIVYYVMGKQRLTHQEYVEEYAKINPTNITVGLTQDTIITQKFVSHVDALKGMVLRFATYNNSLKEGTIDIELKDEMNVIIYKTHFSVLDINDNEDHYIDFGEEIAINKNSEILLTISEYNNKDGNVATLWVGEHQDNCELMINGEIINETLYFSPIGYQTVNFTLQYGIIFVILLLIFSIVCLREGDLEKKGIKTGLNEGVHIFDQYRFLLRKLIGRDFAIKYRRSYLGIVWIILNPLLTMIVLSSVFSFIFRFNIENFPVYLILGQIIFNCFSEATQISLTTITGSGQMIKKIYVPKYIFPLSKTLFSFLNFLLTFIPVVLVMIYYRIPITVNIIYLPVLLAGYFCFVLGVSYILAALQVFMRDTQYLYGIFLTLLGYTTPIFYSVTSLSPRFQKVMLINPLFHYMNTLRTILLYGKTPTVWQLSACIFIGIGFLGFGIRYFFNQQKRFILYI